MRSISFQKKEFSLIGTTTKGGKREQRGNSLLYSSRSTKMDSLAAAKMKATTTATLIIFIAVGCSSAEISTKQIQELQERIQKLEERIEELDELITVQQDEYFRGQDELIKLRVDEECIDKDDFLRDLRERAQNMNNMNNKIKIKNMIIQDHLRLNRQLQQERQQDSLHLQRQQDNLYNQVNNLYKQQELVAKKARFGWLGWLGFGFGFGFLGFGSKQRLEQQLQDLKKEIQDLEKEEKQQEEDYHQKLRGVCCKRQMGNMGIAVGLLTASTFFMLLAWQVFRNLEKQRKASQK